MQFTGIARPEEFRTVTRAHVIAWRDDLELVDFIPRQLNERTLCISIEFATATHKCFCGCGAEVVTPISPVGWQLIFDGETVSLSPSVGSWSLKCKSHYWIRRKPGDLGASDVRRRNR